MTLWKVREINLIFSQGVLRLRDKEQPNFCHVPKGYFPKWYLDKLATEAQQLAPEKEKQDLKFNNSCLKKRESSDLDQRIAKSSQRL